MSDWMLPEKAFGYIGRARNLGTLPYEPHIIEFGSGTGTRVLMNAGCIVTSFEHDPTWAEKTGAIHAPIADDWYDVDTVLRYMPEQADCIIVDGPPGRIGRGGLMRVLDQLPDAPFIVDDVHRIPEMQLAKAISERRKLEASVHWLADGRAFATLGWPW